MRLAWNSKPTYFPLWMIRVFLLFGLGFLTIACGPSDSNDACVNSDDCVIRHEVCRSNLCRQQGSCQQDDDCRYKDETCQEKRCVIKGEGNTKKPPPTTCPTECNATEDCTACPEQRNSCITGRCVKAERAGKYERCGDDVGRACGDKLVCTGTTARKYCIPECDPKQKRCDNDQGGCFDPRKLGVGLCIPDGQAKQGEPCSPNFSGESKLDAKRLCQEGFYCEENGETCQPPKSVASYVECGSGKTCQSGANCVALSSEATTGYCLPECDTSQPMCNNGQGTCVKLSSGKGACLPRGTAKADTLCGPAGPILKPSHFCEAGLRCAGLGASGICLKAVSQCNENACSKDRHCVPGQSGGVCVLRCSSGKSCPNKLRCIHTHAGGGHNNICVP